MTPDLAPLVEAALAGQREFHDVWRQLGAAIEAAPRSRTLRRLRMRLAQAVDMRSEHLADLRVLCELDPRDNKAALELALREFAWSAPAAPAQALHSDRLTQLLALLHRLGSKAPRLAWALEVWDATRVWEPWTRLHMALHACALHPDDAALKRHLALSWAMLMHQPPALDSPEGMLPFGFALDATGSLGDALIGGRALAALRAAIPEGSDDAELLYSRALVQQGLSRFTAAESDFALAARAWDRLADSSGLDPGDAVVARSSADHAFALAQRASGGRETLSRPWMPDSGGGPHTPGTLFSMPTLTGLPPPARYAGPERRSGQRGETSEQTEARLAERAEQTLQQLAAALDPPQAPWQEGPAPAIDPPWLPAAASMEAGGLVPLAWLTHPALRDPSGALAPAHAWRSRDGAVTVLALAVGDDTGIEIASELADGRQLLTTNARGRTCLGGGPVIDVLHVDSTVHLELLLALHRARLAYQLALQPACGVRALRSLADFIASQQRQHAAVRQHRLACGMDEFEALAVPSDLPELFAPMLQQRALAWMQGRAAV